MDNNLRSGAILIACSGAAAIINYVFFMMVGKRLSPEEYSALGFLLSFYFVSGVISGTLYNVVVRYVSYFKAKSQDEKLHQFFINSMALALAIGLGIFAAIASASGIISQRIGTTRWPVLLLGFFIISYFLVNNMLAMMNGRQDFVRLGIYKIIGAAVLIPAGFLLFAYGTSGIILAMAASNALVFVPLLISLRSLFLYRRTGTGDVGITPYLIRALIASALFAILVNMDVIMVRLFFGSTDAGNYAAAAFMAKLPLIISGGFAAVFFPKVAELDSNGEDSIPLLKQALLYTLVIASATFVLYLIFPDFAVSLMFSSSFDIAGLVPWLALAMGLFALLNILVMYYLAKGRFTFIPFLLGGALFLVVAIYAAQTLEEVIAALNLAAFAVACTLAVNCREDLWALLKNRSGYRRFEFVRMWAKLERK